MNQDIEDVKVGKIYAYARVSTDDRGQTTANQKYQLEKTHYKIDNFYYDEGVSGTVPMKQREGYASLLSRLKKGDTVLVTMLDRLSRDTVDALNNITELADMGVSVIIMQFGHIDLSSPFGKFVFTAMAAVATMERDLISQRTKQALEARKAQGMSLGRPSKVVPKSVIMEYLVTKKHGANDIEKFCKKLGVGQVTMKTAIKKFKSVPSNMIILEATKDYYKLTGEFRLPQEISQDLPIAPKGGVMEHDSIIDENFEYNGDRLYL